MQILDVSIVQFAIPVVVVVLFVFLVFALGFKSPRTPPILEIREDDEKVQKTKKNVGKKSGKSVDTRVTVKQPFVPPVPKQANNIHGNVKVTVVAPSPVILTTSPVVVEKVAVAEQPKNKVKKVNKKIDENTNISILSEEVGDWTTAVSKKSRKKKDALSEVTNVPKVGVVAKEKVMAEKTKAEKKNGTKKSTSTVDAKADEDKIVVEKESIAIAIETEDVVEKVEVDGAVDEVVAVEEEVVVTEVAQVTEVNVELDSNVDTSEDLKKKKQKKKNKKADKVVVEEVAPVETIVDVVAPVEEEVMEAIVDYGKIEMVKKKKPESRKKFQEVPLAAATEVEATNGDDFLVQVHQSTPPPPSSKKNKKAKSEDAKLASVPSVSSNVPDSNDDDGDWKQAKPVRRKKQVQREH